MITKRGRSVSRLEGFSDAVFAFSATLLVVALEVPESFAHLVDELTGFGAFAISFAALILIWSVHNAFFRRYGMQDRVTVILNSCLLFVVLFYVYPLKFVAEGLAAGLFGIGDGPTGFTGLNDLSTLFLLYSGGFVAVFTCVSGLYLHAYNQRHELGLNADETREARFYFRHYTIFIGVGLVSIVLAALGWGVGVGMPGWIFALLGPLCYLHGVQSERRSRAAIQVSG